MTSLGLSVTGTLDANVTFAYDGAGNVTGITRTAPSASNPHTITTSYSYNHSNEVTNITAKDTTANLTLANYTYGYNTAGVLTSHQDNSGNSLTYGYDANTELTNAAGTLAGSSYTFTYNYDNNGNRRSTTIDKNGSVTTATYTTGAGNELTNDGTYAETYDYNGNLTQTTNASGTVTYTWDYENRLTEVKTATSDEKFTYDVFGNRIGVSLGTQQLYTVYDGSNPYIDFNGSTLTERYLTNPNGLNQFYGQLSATGTTQWFVTDNLDSVRQVVDSSGNVLDAITYDPYGGLITQTNSSNAPRFLYAGGAYDSTTGNYQFGARWDNPVDGRWESTDPSGLQPDSNPYRYVRNDPTNAVDSSGLVALEVAGGTLTATADNEGTGKAVISFAGPKGFGDSWVKNKNLFKVKQWMQLEVYAVWNCFDKDNKCHEHEYRLPPGKDLEPERPPGTPAHGHPHQSASSLKPELQVDHGDTNDEFSAGPYDRIPQKGDTIMFWDDPDLAQTAFKKAFGHVIALWGYNRTISGMSCKLASVRVVQRFVTVVYVKGNPVATVYWTSTSEGTPPAWTPTVPKVEIISAVKGGKNPVDVITGR